MNALEAFKKLSIKRYRNEVIWSFTIARELKPDWDLIALPSILIYRAGELFDSYIRFIEELGMNFTIKEFEDFLIERKILLS